jgi:flagellar FliL protein
MSEAANPQVPPKKKSAVGRLVLLSVLGAVLVAGGAGGAWFALQGRSAEVATAPAPKKKPQKKQLFTTLETFTVNLQDPRGERFAQIGVTLQFEDPDLEATLKDRLPAVRNAILLLISSKQIEELLTLEGKQKLAEEIRLRAARAAGLELPEPGAAPAKNGLVNPIHAVLFSQFIVQ